MAKTDGMALATLNPGQTKLLETNMVLVQPDVTAC
jgi:hypothetical protein